MQSLERMPGTEEMLGQPTLSPLLMLLPEEGTLAIARTITNASTLRISNSTC